MAVQRAVTRWLAWAFLAGAVLDACATSPPIKDYREAEALSDQALALMHADRNAEAVGLLNRVIAYSREPRDLERRATAYAALNRNAEALRDLDLALAGDRQHWQGYLLRAVTYQKLGRFADAAHDLDAALDMKPDDPELVRQRAYERLLAGAFTESAADYERFA